MKTRLAVAVVALVLAAGAARAEEWKAPEDGVVTEKHVDDFIAYVKALKKVGGTWYGQTSYVLSDVEKKALNEASLDRLEIDWAKPRILLIAESLAVESSKPETWEKAEKKAAEKLATAKKKIDDLVKNGPKEIGELNEVEAELATVSDDMGKLFVQTLILGIKIGEAEKHHDAAVKEKNLEKATKTSDELERLRAEKNKVEDARIELARKHDQLRRRQLEIAEKLQKVGASDGRKQVALANEARRDLEEVQAAKKAKADGKRLDPVLDPSVAAVKAKLGELEKALAALGSPVFDAVAGK